MFMGPGDLTRRASLFRSCRPRSASEREGAVERLSRNARRPRGTSRASVALAPVAGPRRGGPPTGGRHRTRGGVRQFHRTRLAPPPHARTARWGGRSGGRSTRSRRSAGRERGRAAQARGAEYSGKLVARGRVAGAGRQVDRGDERAAPEDAARDSAKGARCAAQRAVCGRR